MNRESTQSESTNTEREDVLLCSVMEVIDAKEEWFSTTMDDVPERVIIAAEDCVTLWQSGDLPYDCRTIVGLVDKLRHEWQEYGMYATAKRPFPKPSFWSVIGELQNALTFAPPVISEIQIESIEELNAEKVPHRQIALIYSHNGVGPFMLNGQPQVGLVKKEINHPGSVIGKDFVHPQILFERERAARYTNHLAKRAEKLRGQNRQIADAPGAVAGPEPIDELIEQGLNDLQISRIKLIPVSEVSAFRKRWEDARRPQPVDSQSPGGQPTGQSREDIENSILEYLVDHPEATNKQVADAVRCEARTVATVRRKVSEGVPA